MTDTQRIVDDLQRLFFAEGDQDQDRIERAHAAYVEEVEQVNRRLRECEELLHRGHRSEAIQRCEGPPNLLDLFATLDFPEYEAWTDYARQFDLAPPPDLMIDIASELNEAYSAELPLAELLRRHRLCALARLPLSPRIAVLRKIAHRDQDNPIWKTDLRAFEKARHAEFRHEVNVAERDGALDVLAELDREVSDSAWLQPPPKSIVERVAAAHRRVRAQQVKCELERMEPELATTHAAGDVTQGRALRERWQGLVADADLEPTQAGGAIAAEFLEWLDDQDRNDRHTADFQSAVEQLERAIDASASREKLDRLAEEVTRMGHELPQSTEKRLSASLNMLARGTTYRRLGLLLATSVALVTVVGVGAWGVDLQRFNADVATAAKQLQALVVEQRLSEAAKFTEELEQADQRVFESSEIRQLRDELSRAETVESQRRIALGQALRTARIDGLEVGTRDALKTAIEQLEQTRETLCRTDEDRTSVDNLRQRLDEQLRSVRQRIDKKYSEFLVKVRTQVEAVQRDDPHNLRKISAVLDEARNANAVPGVSDDLKLQMASVVSNLERMIAAEISYRERTSQLQKITEAVGERREFRSRLELFAQQFANAFDAAEMKRIATSESSLWRAFETWDELIKVELTKQNLTRLMTGEAVALVARVKAQLAEHGPYPSRSNVTGLLNNLEAMARRFDSEGQPITRVLNLPLDNPLVVNLLMLQTKQGDRYYTNQLPRLSMGQWQINAFTDLTVMPRTYFSFKRSRIANRRLGQQHDWQAPQSRFSDLALEGLDRLADGAGWESTFTGFLVELTNDARMDPFLKLQLMRHVLKIARQGSAPLAAAFARHETLLQSEFLDENVNWIDPVDREAQIARKRAERLAKRFPDISVAAEQTLREVEKLKQFSGRRFHWIGWLHRNSDDKTKWRCSMPARTRPATDQALELFVLVAPSGDGQAAGFVQVGLLKSGTLSLRSALCAAGRPVYASRPEPAP